MNMYKKLKNGLYATLMACTISTTGAIENQINTPNNEYKSENKLVLTTENIDDLMLKMSQEQQQANNYLTLESVGATIEKKTKGPNVFQKTGQQMSDFYHRYDNAPEGRRNAHRYTIWAGTALMIEPTCQFVSKVFDWGLCRGSGTGDAAYSATNAGTTVTENGNFTGVITNNQPNNQPGKIGSLKQ